MKSWGLCFVLVAALISGIANFFNKQAINTVGDSFVLTTTKNVLVALILCLTFLLPKIWREARKLTRKQWGLLAAIGLVGGSLPFVLFFKGLALTSAIQASFIHKTLFIWATILAVVLLKEKVARLQLGALVVLLGGNILLDGFNNWHFGWPGLLILLATLLWSCEYIIAKFVLRNVSSWLVAWARMFFGAIVLVVWLIFTGKTSAVASLGGLQWAWIGASAVLLFGYVMTWYAALRREPVSVVASVLVLASPITTLISGVATGKFGLRQLAGAVIIGFAVILIWNLKRREQKFLFPTVSDNKVF